jgi:CBS domain-containing protein/sporulation protein YlmC with PRC-barrel domain
MLYFSELFGRNVRIESGAFVGKIHDFLFLPAESALITKVVLQIAGGKEIAVGITEFKKNGEGFLLSDSYSSSQKADNEVSLLHNLQNQQIIDINGTKIIRVNDVIINDQPDYVISGIDIGVLGVFRWIGVAKLFADLFRRFGIHYKSEFIPWSDLQPSQVSKGRIVLKKEQEKVRKLHPEDLAEHLEHANIQTVLKALRVMDEDMSARVIADLNLDYQKEILGRYSAERAGKILSLIDPDESVDVLLALEKDKRSEILSYVEKGKKRRIEHLMRHAKTPIGHLLASEYITVSSDALIKDVFETVRVETSSFSELLYVYAVNKDNQVVGVMNVHELLLHKSDTPVYKIMNQNLVLGRLTTPKEIVLRRMLKYHIYGMPIVDESRVLLGVVFLQDIAEDMLGENE